MLANILDQVIKTYGKEFLGDWDPINNFRFDTSTLRTQHPCRKRP